MARTSARTACESQNLGFGQFADGRPCRFNPGFLLVSVQGEPEVNALPVQTGLEQESLRVVRERKDVAFAELDILLERQGVPNDPEFRSQWHHGRIGSAKAWNLQFGSAAIKLAIVDSPFQMDHPDLAAHVTNGWDVVSNTEIIASAGDDHSTRSAGMAGAIINNALGVAGVANCTLLPINITGFVSEMYSAIVWAADHGVRVVNLSWDGAYSSTLNAAGLILREKCQGVLVMAGVNDNTRLPYPNQPYIYAISMTDSTDAPRSARGLHIDFAAPGWDIYSTIAGSGYGSDSGTSFSAPLFAGIVAFLMSVNPLLTPDEIESILRETAEDLGSPGPDESYGNGLVNFGNAASLAYQRFWLASVKLGDNGFSLSVPQHPGASYTLLKALSLGSGQWQPIPSNLETNDSILTLTDPNPTPGFYQVKAFLPSVQ